jgi:hypothetical protein
MKQITVKYTYSAESNGDIYLPLYRTKNYTTNGYKFYNNVIYKIAKLDRCSTLLLHYLCEIMDKSNNFDSSDRLRSLFVQHLVKNTKLAFKDETVKKALAKLVKSELVITYGKRFSYTVNPQHIFKGSEVERKKLIQQLIASQIKSKNTKSNFKSALGLPKF